MMADSEETRSSMLPPPPPSDTQGALTEVSLRTMASDLEMMGRSGGGPPSAERITVPLGGSGAAARGGISGIFQRISAHAGLFVWALVGVAAIGFFFIIGFYVIPFFLSLREAPKSSSILPSAPPPQEAPPVFLGHRSFLRVAADTRISIGLERAVSAAELLSFEQQLKGAFTSADPSSTFFEVEVVGAGGRHLAWQEMLTLLGVASLSQEFWEAFSSDFTSFMFRDDDGFWPGYILELKEGENPFVVGRDIARIESASSSIEAFFFTYPGEAMEVFRDAQVAGQPIRIAAFEARGAAFVYGWAFNKYLVISTSLEGFRQALLHL